VCAAETVCPLGRDRKIRNSLPGELAQNPAPGKQKPAAESRRISAARQKLNETPGEGRSFRVPGGGARLRAQTASSLSHVATQKCGAANKICASMDGPIREQESSAAACS
jgi:hypothetical protein